MSEQPGLQGVGRAFDVLERLADGPMTATDVANELGIKWATAHRTLSFLMARGYLERDGRTGSYSVGPRAYAVGGSYLTNLPLRRGARAHLAAAMDESGATVQLVRRDRHRSVVLSVVEPRTDFVPHTSVGFNFPLNVSSKGHVLLAWAPDAVVEAFLSRPLPALTAYSIIDPDDLRRTLRVVRERGYGVSARDTRLFSASVSAPIYQPRGDVDACVTLVVPAADIDAKVPTLVDTVTKAAEAISLMLGWSPSMREPVPED